MESTMQVTRRGLGLAAATPQDVILAAAVATQNHGYSSFWLNNPPQSDALAPLGVLAPIVANIHLGIGIIPLSNRGPEEIARAVREHSVPLDRFYLGIGSGSGGGGLERVAGGIRELRAHLGAATIVVAALGPKMCRLAGAQADGVLLNWLTPEYARRSIEWVREGAEGANRPRPRLMTYVRVALGVGAKARLEKEAGNYEAIPHYAAHFKRMGVSAMGASISADSTEAIQQRLAAWDGVVDEVVVRAIIANNTVEEVQEIIEAARPG